MSILQSLRAVAKEYVTPRAVRNFAAAVVGAVSLAQAAPAETLEEFPISGGGYPGSIDVDKRGNVIVALNAGVASDPARIRDILVMSPTGGELARYSVRDDSGEVVRGGIKDVAAVGLRRIGFIVHDDAMWGVIDRGNNTVVPYNYLLSASASDHPWAIKAAGSSKVVMCGDNSLVMANVVNGRLRQAMEMPNQGACTLDSRGSRVVVGSMRQKTISEVGLSRGVVVGEYLTFGIPSVAMFDGRGIIRYANSTFKTFGFIVPRSGFRNEYAVNNMGPGDGLEGLAYRSRGSVAQWFSSVPALDAIVVMTNRPEGTTQDMVALETGTRPVDIGTDRSGSVWVSGQGSRSLIKYTPPPLTP